MEKFIIEGRRRLTGSVIPSGNKNEALPTLAATLLTEEPVILRNVPRIRDVEVMCQVLQKQGATVEWLSQNDVQICAGGVTGHALDAELFYQSRDSRGPPRLDLALLGPAHFRVLDQNVLPPARIDRVVHVVQRQERDDRVHAVDQ